MRPYMFPGDSLALVLFLFLPQHKLNEELLQLLIAVVNAELLKTATQTQVNRKMTVNGKRCGKYKGLWENEFYIPLVPVVLEDFKTIDIQEAND